MKRYAGYVDDGDKAKAKDYLAKMISDEAAEKAEKDGITGELTAYQKRKYEEKARTKVRTDITNELKPLYLEGVANEDWKATKRVRTIMASTGLYEDIDETFLEWRREEVSEDFKDRYLEAYENGDTKEMDKVIQEMIDTKLWKKPYKTIKTWITNYKKGA